MSNNQNSVNDGVITKIVGMVQVVGEDGLKELHVGDRLTIGDKLILSNCGQVHIKMSDGTDQVLMGTETTFSGGMQPQGHNKDAAPDPKAEIEPDPTPEVSPAMKPVDPGKDPYYDNEYNVGREGIAYTGPSKHDGAPADLEDNEGNGFFGVSAAGSFVDINPGFDTELEPPVEPPEDPEDPNDPRGVDLNIDKVVDDPAPKVGDEVTFTLTVTNEGFEKGTGVFVQDGLPAGLSYISDSPSLGDYDPVTGIWTIGELAVGQVETLTITVLTTGPDPITNVSEVFLNEVDIDPSDNKDDETVDPREADLELVKTVNDSTPNVGDNVIFTVSVTNKGGDDTTDVTVEDLIPAGLQYVADDVNGAFNAVSGVWTIGDLAVNETVTINFITKVLSGDPITNVAQVATSDLPDPDSTPGNNNPDEDDQDDVTIDPQETDLSVTKVAIDPETKEVLETCEPNHNEQITFKITVVNEGPDTAENVVLTDEIIQGLDFNSAIPSKGAYDDASGLWNIGTMVAGEIVTIEITTTVDLTEFAIDGQIPDILTNVATVTTTTAESDLTNNRAEKPFDPQDADLRLDKTVSDETPKFGEDVVFTISVTNDGNDPATGVTVQDVLPADLAYVMDSPSKGDYDANTGIWNIGDLAVGETVLLDVTVTVNTTDLRVNTAQVFTADQFDIDSTPGNNIPEEDDQDDAFVDPEEADLEVKKILTEVNGEQVPGDDCVVNHDDLLTFVISVTNTDDKDASNNVVLSELLPAGLDFVSASPSEGSYNNVTGLWSNVDLNPGEVATLTIVAKVDLMDVQQEINPGVFVVDDTIINTASIFSVETPDNNSSNDQDSKTVDPKVIDLELTKTVDDTTPELGSDVTFTVVLDNKGPDGATGVVVDDLLPAGLTFVAASVPLGTSYDSNSGVWTVGDLAANGSLTLELTATVNDNDALLGTTITNVGEVVAANEYDPDSTPNNDILSEDDQDDASIIPEETPVPQTAVGLADPDAPLKEDIGGVINISAMVGDPSDELTMLMLQDLGGWIISPAEVAALQAAPGVLSATFDDALGKLTIVFDADNQDIQNFTADIVLTPGPGVEDTDVDVPAAMIMASVRDILDPTETATGMNEAPLPVDAILDQQAVVNQTDMVMEQESTTDPLMVELKFDLTLEDAGFAGSLAGGVDDDGSEQITSVIVELDTTDVTGTILQFDGSEPVGSAIIPSGGDRYEITVANNTLFEGAVEALKLLVPQGQDGDVSGIIEITRQELNTPAVTPGVEVPNSGVEFDNSDNVRVTRSEFMAKVKPGTSEPETAIGLADINDPLKEDLGGLVTISAAVGDPSDELTMLMVQDLDGWLVSADSITALNARPDVISASFDDVLGKLTIVFDETQDIQNFTADIMLVPGPTVEDSDVDIANAKITAMVQDITDPTVTNSGESMSPLVVDAILDEQAVVSQTDMVMENEDPDNDLIVELKFDLTLENAGFTGSLAGGVDDDGSEQITSVIVELDVSDVPGTILQFDGSEPGGSAIIPLGGDRYEITVPSADLYEGAVEALKLLVPQGQDGDVTGVVEITRQELNTPAVTPGIEVPNSGVEFDNSDNVRITRSEFMAKVKPGTSEPETAIGLADINDPLKEDLGGLVNIMAQVGDPSDELTMLMVQDLDGWLVSADSITALNALPEVVSASFDDVLGKLTIVFDETQDVQNFTADIMLVPGPTVEDSDVDIANAKITAMVQDITDPTVTNSGESMSPLVVDAILDEQAVVEQTDMAMARETAGAPTMVELNFDLFFENAGFTGSLAGGVDDDGSEEITLVQIELDVTNVPNAILTFDGSQPGGATLTKLAVPGDVYELSGVSSNTEYEQAVEALKIQAPSGERGDLSGTVLITTQEANTPEGMAPASGQEPDLSDNTRTTHSDFTATIKPGFASLGDRVWEDLDGNGLQDQNEPGVEGVTVNLYKDLNDDGLINGAELLTPFDTTTTGFDGFYEFNNLEPTTYQVEFIKPVGTEFTTQDVNGNGNDDIDSDADTTFGFSDLIVLTPNENNPTIDAGIYVPVKIGNFVWDDQILNGQQDPSEPGINGVIINLYKDLDGNGTVDGTDFNSPVATTVSATNGADRGFYEFADLMPGTYKVEFILPDALGREFTLPNVGDDATDSDSNSFTSPGLTDDINLVSGVDDLTIDAGTIVPDQPRNIGFGFDCYYEDGQPETADQPGAGPGMAMVNFSIVLLPTDIVGQARIENVPDGVTLDGWTDAGGGVWTNDNFQIGDNDVKINFPLHFDDDFSLDVILEYTDAFGNPGQESLIGLQVFGDAVAAQPDVIETTVFDDNNNLICAGEEFFVQTKVKFSDITDNEATGAEQQFVYFQQLDGYTLDPNSVMINGVNVAGLGIVAEEVLDAQEAPNDEGTWFKVEVTDYLDNPLNNTDQNPDMEMIDVKVTMTAPDDLMQMKKFTYENLDVQEGNSNGGDIKQLTTMYNQMDANHDDKETFMLTMKIEDITEGFTLVVNDGPNPKGIAGELAIIYVDFNQGGEPRITVYEYNGQNNMSSHVNGNLLASSVANSDFILENSLMDMNGDQVVSFTLDVGDINNAVPGLQWSGIEHGMQAGFWLHPFTNLNSDYDANGEITQWSGHQGWFDVANLPTTMEEIKPMINVVARAVDNPTDEEKPLDNNQADDGIDDPGKVMVDPTLASIGDFVWNDLNANGLQDGNEVGIEGITVKLYKDLNGNGTVDNAELVNPLTTETNADGFYEFDELKPGTYKVEFVAPNGFSFTTQDANGNASDTIDSDADEVTGFTDDIVLGSKENNDTVDAGLLPDNLDIDLEKLVQTGEITFPSGPVCEDLKDNGEKIAELTLLYTAGDSSVSNDQEGRATVSGDVGGDNQVYIIIFDGSDIYFEGTVNEGETFVATAANAGEDKFSSNTEFEIYSSQGGTLLQSGEYHTSCSKPIFLGDKIGALNLVGVTGDDGTRFEPIVTLTTDDADVPTGPEFQVGDEVNWIYEVTNDGDVDIQESDIVLVDDNGTPGDTSDDFSIASGDITLIDKGDGDGVLEVNETWVYTASGIAEEGQYRNDAKVTVEANGQMAMDEDPAHYFGVLPNVDVDLEKLVQTGEITFPSGPVCEDLKDNGEKIAELTLLYTAGDSSVSNDQEGKATVTGDVGGDNQVYIIIFDGSDIYFEGTVNEGETFVATAANAGEDKFSSNTEFEIYSSQGGTLLQSGEYHTSCSKPIFLGDKIGALNLVGVTGDDGTRFEPIVTLTTDDADVPTGPEFQVGDEVNWIYEVTNDGEVDIQESDIVLVDDNGTPGDTSDDFSIASGDITLIDKGDGDGILEVNETWVYTASGIAEEGQYRNDAKVTVEANGQMAMDEDPAHYFGVLPDPLGIVINEVGLGKSVEQNQYGFEIWDGDNYIELFNTSTETISEDEIRELSVEVVGPSGNKVTIDLDTFDVTAGSLELNPGEMLVLYEDGQRWAIYDNNGNVDAHGMLDSQLWGFGDTTMDNLAVNLVRGSISLDTLLANDVDTVDLTGSNFWDGAEQRNAVNNNQLNASLLLGGVLLNNDLLNGLAGDQDAVLDKLMVDRPNAGTTPNVNDSDGDTMVFARVYAANDGSPIDSNTEMDWTFANQSTQGLLNSAVDDINGQDPDDDFDPRQGEGSNASDAGQTVLEANVDGQGDDLTGGRGADHLFGDHNNNDIAGGDHNDVLYGASGDDRLYGGDDLFGGQGADVLIDVDGQDVLVGNSGDDIIISDIDVLKNEGNLLQVNDQGDLLIGDNVVEGSENQFSITFVIDVSGSMGWGFDGDRDPDAGESRLDFAKVGFNALVDSIVDAGLAGSTHIQIVTFNTGVTNNVAFASADDPGIKSLIDGLSAGGGTQYEPPLADAADWQDGNQDGLSVDPLADSQRIIYFLSDGGDNNGAGGFDSDNSGLEALYDGTFTPGEANPNNPGGFLGGVWTGGSIEGLSIRAFGFGSAGGSDFLPDELDEVVRGPGISGDNPTNDDFDYAEKVDDPENLSAQLTAGSLTSAPAGKDVIIGGAEDDIIFGDNLAVNEGDLNAVDADPMGYVEANITGPNADEDLVNLQHAMGQDDWIDGGAGDDVIFGQGGDDEILGNDGHDTIYGGHGDDWIAGGKGADTMEGGQGSDMYSWQMDDLDGGLVDIITDFDETEPTDGGDVLQLGELLDNVFDDMNDNIGDFVELREESGNTIVSVDSNGTTGGGDYEDVVVLEGKTGLDLQDLFDQGNIDVS